MMSSPFMVLKRDNDTSARIGCLDTCHGKAETPLFMPVGTRGTVRGVKPDELEKIGIRIVLSNAYHLYLQPGIDIVEKMGGLHSFMGWKGPILTDSGGFQIMSLCNFSHISDEGVTFQSHIDGSKHFLSPEKVIDIQKALGIDIIMCLDECVSYPASYDSVKKSMELSLEWAQRSRDVSMKNTQKIFGIVQGGVYKELREKSARELVKMDFDGYAIGGLSVGEEKKDTYDIIGHVASLLPDEMPRYAMGIGTPLDIIEAVINGIDMMDCVLPTRNGRNGQLFTHEGKIVIKQAQYRTDDKPIDSKCSCYTCKNFSRAYVRHLYMNREILSSVLCTLHNLKFYADLFSEIRNAIKNNSLYALKAGFEKAYGP
ncbi:MAG: tRNA guanosine(34) transglycosylase Tgt [bacterium]